MKKFIKKIGLILMMAFVIGIGYGVSAKAATDEGVVGTTNLNNTDENSAKVGERLSSPEKGWKRYRDDNSNITYSDKFKKEESINIKGYVSDDEIMVVYGIITNQSAKFNFTGNKIRLVSYTGSNRAKQIMVQVDNQPPTQMSINTNLSNQIKNYVFYENLNLENSEHSISIIILDTTDNVWFGLDNVDIDESGTLKPYNNQSITLNKNSISLSPGKTENLTATVTPDNIKDKKIIWSTSDKSIAAVDENGKVRALKEGNVVITATVDGTDLKTECKVTVTKEDIPVEPSQGDATLTITMTNGNIKSYNVSMKTVNKFIEWYEDRASGSNGMPFYKFDKTRNEDEIKTEYIVFDKISSFQVEQNK